MRTRCGGGEAVCPQSWDRDPSSWSPIPRVPPFSPIPSSMRVLEVGLGSFVLDFFLVEGKTGESFGKWGMGLSWSKLPIPFRK